MFFSHEPLHSNTAPRPGYVVSLSLWEQLTMAARNLIQLQCWAGRLTLNVVEPSLNSTYFMFTFNQTRQNQLMRLDRLFDMEAWKRQSQEDGIAPLVPREEFERELSVYDKNVILVQMSYSLQDGPSNLCSFNWSREISPGLLRYRMHVVRSVCVDGNQKTLADFDHIIFGNIPRENSVVIFNEWRAFGPDRLVPKPSCAKAGSYACRKPLSHSIKMDAEIYAQRYLGGIGQYLAIMTRFERTVPKFWTLTKAGNKKHLQRNMENVLNTWVKLKEDHPHMITFLTFDYGKFGSDSFKQWDYFGAEDLLLGFHRTIYEGNLSLDEWESSFGEVAHTDQSAYIAMLQLQIVSNAKCVILAGDNSNFLMSAFNMYMEKHVDSNSACIQLINKKSKDTPKACKV